MCVVDTDAVSEARKRDKANAGVRSFSESASRDGTDLYLSVIKIGEPHHGVERIRYRGDRAQAQRLERWLGQATTAYADRILPLDEETAHVWGRRRVPHPENPLDKQIAATALIHDLMVVTRNVEHYKPTDVGVLNPFS